jgi:hypothetical protein
MSIDLYPNIVLVLIQLAIERKKETLVALESDKWPYVTLDEI